jgi:hypothetical protein
MFNGQVKQNFCQVFIGIKSFDTTGLGLLGWGNRPVLAECLTAVIIPDFDGTRKTVNLHIFPGILLYDNRGSYVDEQIRQLPVQRNIRLSTFPPHMQ